eukprot:6161-Chlamydomonas_euryale.AAC.2
MHTRAPRCCRHTYACRHALHVLLAQAAGRVQPGGAAHGRRSAEGECGAEEGGKRGEGRRGDGAEMRACTGLL